MKIGSRFRLTLLAAMLLVGLFAVVFAWVAAERERRIEALAAELRAKQTRVRWAEAMRRRGYLSKAEFSKTIKQKADVEARLEALGAAVAPRRP